MTANEYIDKLRNDFINAQIISSELDSLIEKNNVEQRDVKGYQGREILELLQNADDAYQKLKNEGNAPDCELEIDISYINNILTISNTGTSFDEDGVKAIVQGNNSPKKKGFIGNKGTGFRSILNWAKAVSIDSGEFHIFFSEEIANRIFEDIRNMPQIQKQLEKEPKLYIPMLAVPENKKNAKIDDRTTIEILINPDKSKDEYSVQKQIDELDLRILLFLPNTNRIEIKTEDKIIIYERVKDDSSPEVLLEKKVNGEIVAKEDFLLFEKKLENFAIVDNEFRDARLSIAVSKSMDSMENARLYSFFPVLKASSPFKCLFHATYELDDQRNNLQDNQINYNLIKEQLCFLFNDVANYFIEQKDYKTLYEIIVPELGRIYIFKQPFLVFEKFGIDDYYLELFGKSKIFRTVNGLLVSLENKPKIIKGEYPKKFKGPGFESLIEPIENQNILELIKRYSDKYKTKFDISDSELLEVINKQSEYWGISDQVNVFIWWNEKRYASLPNLLKDGENKWLKYKQDCYFLVGDIDENLIPKWSKIPALNKDYQEELLLQAELLPQISAKINGADKQPTHRVIAQNVVFPCLSFHYIDRSTVISLVNSSVDSYETAILFVKWLWKNYNDNGWQPPDNVSFRFPAANNNGKQQIESPQKIYFGDDYGNGLAELLFDDSYRRLPNASEFDIKQDGEADFTEFLHKFGVVFFPIIAKKTLDSATQKFDSYYQDVVRKKEGLQSKDNVSCAYEVPFIERLDEILKRIKTINVIEWIAKDRNLLAYVSNSLYNESEARVQYKFAPKKNFRDLKCSVRNYILETFNEIPWIQIGNNRYSPREVLKNSGSGINSKFSKLLPIIDSEYVSKIAEELNLKFDVVGEIFNKFDLCENPTELPSDQFYGLMLKIPSLNNMGEAEELSRTIYRIIERSEFNRKYENSQNFKNYQEKGKILVKYKGIHQFYDAKEAFLPSSKIVNTHNLPIVVKGQRTGNENFKCLFGCKEYDKSYEIEKVTPAVCDDKFQEFFKEFKKYAQAYSSKNTKIAENGPKLTIQLAEQIEILIGGDRATIDEEYTPVRKTVSCWYVTCFEENFDNKKLSIAIEKIYENIANTAQFESGKIGELFRESDKLGREFLIEKEFGSLDVIDDTNYEIEIRNNFIQTVNKIDSKYDVDALDIDFEHFESELNAEKMIQVLKVLGKDVEEFQKEGFVYSIDLIPYYKELSRKLIQDESRKYKNYLFTTIKNEESQKCSVEELKNKFIDKVRKFESFVIKEIPNSVSFDVREKIKEEFGDWECLEVLLNAENEYSANYGKLNPENKFGDDISNSTIVKTMIYFNRTDDFNEWLNSKERELSQSEQKKNDVYAKLRNVAPEETEIGYRDGTLFTESINGKRGQGAVTKKGKEKKDRNQKIAGNKGELLVYNLLCKKYGKDNVFPRSEAYVELDILKPGQAVSGDYDISYKDSAGNEFYVEVKTGDSQSFFVSPDEMKFARENVERYELIYVHNLDNDVPNYHTLPKKFWEDPRYQKKEIVEKIEFRF